MQVFVAVKRVFKHFKFNFGCDSRTSSRNTYSAVSGHGPGACGPSFDRMAAFVFIDVTYCVPAALYEQ